MRTAGALLLFAAAHMLWAADANYICKSKPEAPRQSVRTLAMFRADGQFAEVGAVMRTGRSGQVTVDPGPGVTIRFGTWQRSDNGVRTKWRLIYEAIPKIGDVFPGPEQQQDWPFAGPAPPGGLAERITGPHCEFIPVKNLAHAEEVWKMVLFYVKQSETVHYPPQQ